MKTAEQWNCILDEKYNSGQRQTDDDQMEVIKQIQLDAWKQGMSDAAKVALEGADFFAGHKSLVIACKEVARNISINEKAKTEL